MYDCDHLFNFFVLSLFIVFWSFLRSLKKDLCRKCAKNIYKQDAGRGPPWATVETDAEIYHPCNCLGFLGNCPELLTIRPNGGSCSSLPLYFHPDSIGCIVEDQAMFAVVWFGSFPLPSSLSSVSNLSLFPLYVADRTYILTGEGGGREGEGAK